MRSTAILLIALFSMVAIAKAVLVDGYCYLAGEQDHDDTLVLFEAASPTAETDSVLTDPSGFYEIDLAIGIYDVHFSHGGYLEEVLPDQVFLDPQTLSDVTLQFDPEFELSGPIFGHLPKAIYHVVDDLSVTEGGSLRIEAGTEFRFCGPYSFTIGSDQRLLCEGTEQDSIRFLPDYGGGIIEWKGLEFHSSDDDDIVSYCRISGAHKNHGGGINCVVSDPIISHCLISDNTADNLGGGIRCYYANPSISDCTISGNTAGDEGGGIICGSESTPSFINCIIVNNEAMDSGGGVYFWSSTNDVVFKSCVVSHNSANEYGGGIYCYHADPSITSCTIFRNNSSENGGGLATRYAYPIVNKCTITNNEAIIAGGGIWSYNYGPVISNTMITNNINHGIYAEGGDSELEITFCNIYGNSGGNYEGPDMNPLFGDLIFENTNGDSCDIYLNISFDPLYVDPVQNDFHLQETSPCIDAGDPDYELDPDDTITDIGTFYFDQSSSSVLEQIGVDSPSSFKLRNAYPNPFNASTTLTVNLPEISPLTLAIYNITGQRVKTVSDGTLSAGTHTFTVDASSLSSGIYFVSAMVPGRRVEVQKIMLIN